MAFIRFRLHGVWLYLSWIYSETIWSKMAVDIFGHSVAHQLARNLFCQQCVLLIRSKSHSRLCCCGNILIWSFIFGGNFQWQVRKSWYVLLSFSPILIFFSLRGTITSTLMLSANTGILVAFAISFLGYSASPVFAITTTIIFVILFVMFPETPLFLVKQNKISVNFISNSNKYKA